MQNRPIASQWLLCLEPEDLWTCPLPYLARVFIRSCNFLHVLLQLDCELISVLGLVCRGQDDKRLNNLWVDAVYSWDSLSNFPPERVRSCCSPLPSLDPGCWPRLIPPRLHARSARFLPRMDQYDTWIRKYKCGETPPGLQHVLRFILVCKKLRKAWVCRFLLQLPI